MAQTLSGTPALDYPSPQVRSLNLHLRLALGLIILLGTIIFFIGVSWDIQWHSFIGRDRTLIPPHVMMLFGDTISGLAALIIVLIETVWARRKQILAPYSTTFAGGFSGPMGAYIAGFGALNTAIAFVLDSYWHAVYGIDVSIWAPFHIMLLVGMVIVGLGSAFMLASVAHLARMTGAKRTIRAGYLGTCAAFSTIIAILAILMIDGVNNPQGYIHLSGIMVNTFPLLAGLCCSWVLVTAITTIPWRWTATLVSGITILLLLTMAAFVPPAMDFLMGVEHLTYRQVATTSIDPHLPLMAVEWPLTTTFLAAILIDVFAMLARRRGWSRRTLALILVLAALPVCLPVMPILPIGIILDIWQHTGMIGIVLTIGLGLLGTLIGSWLGQHTGQALQAGR